MLYVILGVVTAFNFLIVKYKVEHNRYGDATYDILAIVALNYFFAGTLGGMVIAMTASLIISLYLLRFPPRVPAWSRNERKIVWK